MSFFRRSLRFLENRYLGHPALAFKAALKTFFITHFIWEYHYSIAPTQGPSMLPTFEVVNDTALVSRWYRRGRGVQVGDVVSFKSVVNHEEDVIKRVIGLEGDIVMRDTPGSGSETMIQVPEGHCWVVGDNLPASRDSRMFGPMPMALIRGKIIAKIGPFAERKWLENPLQPPQ